MRKHTINILFQSNCYHFIQFIQLQHIRLIFKITFIIPTRSKLFRWPKNVNFLLQSGSLVDKVFIV